MGIEQKVLSKLRCVLDTEDKEYPLHEPVLGQEEKTFLNDCIDSGYVSSVGEYVNLFELQLSQFTGIDNVIATVNGTAALHVCLLLSDVGENDEVLVSALTFVATVNAISYCRAMPHFVDANPDTLGVDVEALKAYLRSIATSKEGYCYNKETGRRIKAICVTHVCGLPADLKELSHLCEEYNIKLVEDAAEGLGSFYLNRHVGSYSSVAALSFNGNKIITTGGGGAILTNDNLIAEKARHLTTTAKIPSNVYFSHDRIAFNYRLPNLNAALGCAQFLRLEKYIQLKRWLASEYQMIFSEETDMRVLAESENSRSNYWLNALLITDKAFIDLKALILFLHSEKIYARPVWLPMHKLEMYKECPSMSLYATEYLYKRLIFLPSSPAIMMCKEL